MSFFTGFIVFFIGLVIGLVIGLAVGVILMAIAMQAVLEKHGMWEKLNAAIAQDKDKKNTPSAVITTSINFIVELHHGIYYVFNRDTNAFVTQGATPSEVVDDLKKKYPSYVVEKAAEIPGAGKSFIEITIIKESA